MPAAFAPVGEIDAATATSMPGSLYGLSCRRASWRLNQSVRRVTVSPRKSAMITSSASSMRGRCMSAGMPSMCASEVSCPGPQPSMARPRVRWSSSTKRSASIRGLWYGREFTPLPRRMYFVRAAAAAMKTSGDEMISYPPEWCSPIQTSWKPMRSRCSIRSRSRSRASVGFCPVGWNGAMKSPKRIRGFDPALDRSVNSRRRFVGGTEPNRVPARHPREIRRRHGVT